MVYVYDDWTLYRREIIRENGDRQTVYFFYTRIPPKGVTCDLPDGYKVLVNKLTGLPYITKK